MSISYVFCITRRKIKMNAKTVTIICFTSLWALIAGYTYPIDIVEEQCRSNSKHNISMSYPAGKLLLSRPGHFYGQSLHCEHTITAPPGTNIVLTFNWIDLHGQWGFSCVDDMVQISDGQSATDPLCGYYYRPPVMFRTTSNFARVVVNTGGILNNRRGFEIAYTAVHYSNNGQCQRSEFRCINNLCIDSQLKCDISNNCGDFSDEACRYANCKCKLSAGAIVGIVFACLFVTGMFIVACLCCCRSQKKQREAVQRGVVTREQAVVMYPPTAMPTQSATSYVTTTTYPADGSKAPQDYNNPVYGNYPAPPPYSNPGS